MNELAKEDSPYLRQHANNPVHWKAWNAETIRHALKQDKPLIISIGYATCHWCHVMERESFENEEVAAIMNANFICIKVDREERPDIDHIYMTAATIVSGRGGWPLNCFALPDGRPFHAGTYYPREGWIGLMYEVIRRFNETRNALEDYAGKLTRGIQLQETLITDAEESSLDASYIIKAIEHWKDQWDLQKGGMLGAPKFPIPVHYSFLFAYTFQRKDHHAERFIETSLQAMACGGIYDQVGGGFSRYAVDDAWKVPHFEKMLYDNAQLLEVYSLAYQRYKQPFYREVLEDICSWLFREMEAPTHLFYSGIDADSEGEEGLFYCWTEQALGEVHPRHANEIKEYFKFGIDTHWEAGKHILQRKFPKRDERRSAEIDGAIDSLLQARAKRIRPITDDKCLTSWNGMLLSGLSKAWILGELPSLQKTLKVLADACREQFRKDGALMHMNYQGRVSQPGLLEDYVFLAQGFLDSFQASGDEVFFQEALLLINEAIAQFYHAEKGIFYLNKDADLIVQSTELYDNVIPSTNASMCLLLLKAGLLALDQSMLDISKRLISRMQDHIAQHPSSSAKWAEALLAWTRPYYEIVICGPKAASWAAEMQRELPCYPVCFATYNSDLQIFKDRFKPDKTQIFICRQGACEAPITDFDEALQFIHSSLLSDKW